MKQVINIRTIASWSTIAFFLSRNPRASSFSTLNPPHVAYAQEGTSRSHLTNAKQFSSFAKPRHQTLTFLSRHRGGETTNSVKMTSSATTECSASTAAVPTTPSPKLDALRSKMKSLNIDAYVVPTDDPHLSEYVSDAYMRRAFLTGFKGSAGTAVVTNDKAFLWTDSRYVILLPGRGFGCIVQLLLSRC